MELSRENIDTVFVCILTEFEWGVFLVVSACKWENCEWGLLEGEAVYIRAYTGVKRVVCL